MEHLINWMTVNAMLCRVIFAICGLTGLFILNRTRSHFYTNRSSLWWGIVVIVYMILGPAILLFGIMTIFFDKLIKQNKKTKNAQSSQSHDED